MSHNDVLYIAHCPPKLVMMINSRKMSMADYVATVKFLLDQHVGRR